jgi:hypothetical protein
MVSGSMVGMRIWRSDGSTSFRYFHQDHLGSIAVITNESGTLAEARDAYDAWGKRRNPNGSDDPTGSIVSQTSRGFTGEEMLASVGLVHLNGRVVACPRAGAAGPGGPVHRAHDQRRPGGGRSAQRADLEPLFLRLEQPARLYRPDRLLPGLHRHRQSAAAERERRRRRVRVSLEGFMGGTIVAAATGPEDVPGMLAGGDFGGGNRKHNLRLVRRPG